MQSDWLSLLPIIIFAAAGCMIFCIGACRHSDSSAFLFGLAITSCLAAGLTAIFLQHGRVNFAGQLNIDAFSRFYTVLFSVITIIVLLFSFQYARARDFGGDEFYGIILFAAAGMVIIASAIHWLLFFLGLEMLSICLYIIIAIRREDDQAVEAAIKYFIVGAVASAFLAFGIAMLYAATGTLDIVRSLTSSTQGGNSYLRLLALCLILVGLGFKISLVPFHLWTPDVYQGAPAPVTAFLATGSKVAVFTVFIRMAACGAAGAGHFFLPALWSMAALTMIIGNIIALSQTSIKRLLAYSSIAQVGYMMMALLAVKQQGIAAVIFYSVVYAVMDLGAFGTIGLLSPHAADLDRIEDYRGLGYSRPFEAALLTICLFSLAGLPTTAGFIGKFILFRAALAANFITLALIGLLTAIVSLYFYLKVVVVLYMRPAEKVPDIDASGGTAKAACLLVGILTFWLGLFPSSLLNLISRLAGLVIPHV